MKYYCIEFDNCGYYTHAPDWAENTPEICPLCFSLILKYEDTATPIFNSHPASYDAGSGEVSFSDENE